LDEIHELHYSVLHGGEKGRFLRIVTFLTMCARISGFHTPAQTVKSHKTDAKGAMQALHRSFCVI
jgi:hypothetical protein